ncbi:DsbA family protein [Janibacter cremeus]|uniref:Protein-disulfide isomerase n=1 Tax=Janibacter cremeus TaxID=1285192 RepID=A0A852VQX5_9MICO|nr:thioredoxin domain-containing protein [Janibacter cremeus]NYF98339.1 protein-disulfide isomerase [Janibacter cremeus]
MSDKTRRVLAIILALAMVGSLAAGVILSSLGGGTGGSAPDAEESKSSSAYDNPREAEDDIGLARREADDPTAMGDVDAPLVLIEYADYRCPYCGVFNRDTLPTIVEEYVETGRIRIEWRDLPLFGEQSSDAAVAARAAGKQGRFWEYHDAVYADAPEEEHLEVTRDKLLGWAQEVDVPDMDQFEEDLDDPRLLELVRADAHEGEQVGATGTPTFVIGHEALVGAQSIGLFRDLLDDQLEAVGEQ